MADQQTKETQNLPDDLFSPEAHLDNCNPSSKSLFLKPLIKKRYGKNSEKVC
jgi:hypothetical protein